MTWDPWAWRPDTCVRCPWKAAWTVGVVRYCERHYSEAIDQALAVDGEVTVSR